MGILVSSLLYTADDINPASPLNQEYTIIPIVEGP